MSVEAGKQAETGASGAKAARVENAPEEGTTRATSMVPNVSPELLRIMEQARDPEYQFFSLAHLIDLEALRRGFGRIRRNAAVGVDGVSKEQYERTLSQNLQALHENLKEMRWRHQPTLRVQIPKEGGKTRPIGISATEDKIVQEALRELLVAVYEPIFRPCSYGFRPRRGAHDALRALNGAVVKGEGKWILEVDIESFFDSIDRTKLMKMLQERIRDGTFLRLIGKCLHVGILEGGAYSEPGVGTVQGSVLSPVLGNIFLHHVFDLWFEREVTPRMQGAAVAVRYADDLLMVFDSESDARRVMEVLPKRFARFGLKLHPDKTRLFPFKRPPRGQKKGKGPSTFEFLGFTHFWRRARSGMWMPWMKTRKARLSRFLGYLSDWCRRNRHAELEDQHVALCRRIKGYFAYFGVNGNVSTLRRVTRAAERTWLKWLQRRSQRSRLNWTRFAQILRQFPLPVARVYVQIWVPLS